MRPGPRRALAAGAFVVAALVAGLALVPDLGADRTGASPATLSRIAQKNDRAATEAAAKLRAESRASAQAADRVAAEENVAAAPDE
jgi:hypothetical protein